MSPLVEAVTEYLQLRRALGYKLEREGRELPKFVEFLEQHDATVITTELALAWTIQPAAATAHPILCSRSSRASEPPDYVEPDSPIPALRRTSRTPGDIVPCAT